MPMMPMMRFRAITATLRDQDKLFGAVASDPTARRVVDRVDPEHLARLREALLHPQVLTTPLAALPEQARRCPVPCLTPAAG